MPGKPEVSKYYEIHVRGHLDACWSDWLEGLRMCAIENGETVFSGRIVDQAALMGILNRLHRLNLAILSLKETAGDNPGEQ